MFSQNFEAALLEAEEKEERERNLPIKERLTIRIDEDGNFNTRFLEGTTRKIFTELRNYKLENIPIADKSFREKVAESARTKHPEQFIPDYRRNFTYGIVNTISRKTIDLLNNECRHYEENPEDFTIYIPDYILQTIKNPPQTSLLFYPESYDYLYYKFERLTIVFEQTENINITDIFDNSYEGRVAQAYLARCQADLLISRLEYSSLKELFNEPNSTRIIYNKRTGIFSDLIEDTDEFKIAFKESEISYIEENGKVPFSDLSNRNTSFCLSTICSSMEKEHNIKWYEPRDCNPKITSYQRKSLIKNLLKKIPKLTKSEIKKAMKKYEEKINTPFDSQKFLEETIERVKGYLTKTPDDYQKRIDVGYLPEITEKIYKELLKNKIEEISFDTKNYEDNDFRKTHPELSEETISYIEKVIECYNSEPENYHIYLPDEITKEIKTSKTKSQDQIYKDLFYKIKEVNEWVFGNTLDIKNIFEDEESAKITALFCQKYRDEERERRIQEQKKIWEKHGLDSTRLRLGERYNGHFYDAIEETEEYKKAMEILEPEAETACKKKYGSTVFRGCCHFYWDYYQKNLKKRFNIDWYDPVQCNPGCCFD